MHTCKLINRRIGWIPAAALAILCWCLPVWAGCSDDDFLKADEIYQSALKESSSEKKVELLELAFQTCPSHGSFTEGYYLLGKLYNDSNDKDKALQWLSLAHRFSGSLLERSEDELAQTNLLLGNIYRGKGNTEKALIHFNIYRALTKMRDKKLERNLIADADAMLSVVYSPKSIAETLTIDKSVSQEARSKLNRIEVYFDFARANLDDEAKKRLDSIGSALQGRAFEGCTLIMEGHTDEVGGIKSNCELGNRRAKAAEQYLTQRWGFKGITLIPVTYGKSAPVISRQGHSNTDWPKIDRFNRRVVIWNSGSQTKALKDITVDFESRSPCSK